MDRVDGLRQPLGDLIEQFRRDRVLARPGGGLLRQAAGQGLDIAGDLVGIALVMRGDAAQDLRKARAAPALGRREIGPAPERLAGGGQEHGQGPAALFAHQRQRLLVDRVDVGPFLAIDLDRDIELVHDRGDGRVLEAFRRHDMAPVTGGIADGQQDRLGLRLGLGKRRRAPGAPMDRIVLVLQQVGAGFGRKLVRCHDTSKDGSSAAIVPSGASY